MIVCDGSFDWLHVAQVGKERPNPQLELEVVALGRPDGHCRLSRILCTGKRSLDCCRLTKFLLHGILEFTTAYYKFVLKYLDDGFLRSRQRNLPRPNYFTPTIRERQQRQ